MAQELNLKLKAAEKDLRAARLKLDDGMVDTSMEDALEAKVGALMEELYAAKSDLETAQKRAADYKSIAKSNEEELTELTFALTKYNDEMMAELERLRKSDSSKQEAVAELTWNLMSHREEREKTVAKVDSLTLQLTF